MKRYYFNKLIVVLVLMLAVSLSAILVFSIATSDVMSFRDLICAILCLILIQYAIKYGMAALKNTPALVINNEGIFDYQSGLTFQWRDIQSYRIYPGSVSYVKLEVNNPTEYIKTIKNPFTRWVKQAFKLYTFNLNLSLLTEQNERILDQIEYYDLEAQRSFLESL
jgi:hypothetical protein